MGVESDSIRAVVAGAGSCSGSAVAVIAAWPTDRKLVGMLPDVCRVGRHRAGIELRLTAATTTDGTSKITENADAVA